MSVRRAAGGAVLVFLVASGFSRTTAAQAPLPELTEPVHDFANVIDPANEQEIDKLSRALKAATGDVVVIVTVKTVAPYADLLSTRKSPTSSVPSMEPDVMVKV